MLLPAAALARELHGLSRHPTPPRPAPPRPRPAPARSDTLWDDYSMAKFIPFNPTDKYTVAFVKDKATGEITRIMKGAPQVRRRHGGIWGRVRPRGRCGACAGSAAAARPHHRTLRTPRPRAGGGAQRPQQG